MITGTMMPIAIHRLEASTESFGQAVPLTQARGVEQTKLRLPPQVTVFFGVSLPELHQCFCAKVVAHKELKTELCSFDGPETKKLAGGGDECYSVIYFPELYPFHFVFGGSNASDNGQDEDVQFSLFIQSSRAQQDCFLLMYHVALSISPYSVELYGSISPF